MPSDVDGLVDQGEVTVVTAYYNWNHKGITRAWWLWTAATTPWLDDATGKPRRPIDLRLRTPASLAVHGANPRGFVHRAFHDAAGPDAVTNHRRSPGVVQRSPAPRRVDGRARR